VIGQKQGLETLVKQIKSETIPKLEAVLDPFMESGTTLFAAEKLKRNSIGIDILEEYCQMVKDEVKEKELYLFEKEEEYALVNK
jgi:DNA modification methylase